jgi:hypothetical protein
MNWKIQFDESRYARFIDETAAQNIFEKSLATFLARTINDLNTDIGYLAHIESRFLAMGNDWKVRIWVTACGKYRAVKEVLYHRAGFVRAAISTEFLL